MKKRILSFALACFMVLSTFIISKPIARVYAIEKAETEYVTPTTIHANAENKDTLIGRGFQMYYRYKADEALTSSPMTIEAWIKVDETASDERLYAIYSNYSDAYNDSVALEIAAGGVPRFYWQQSWDKCNEVIFTEVDVRTGEWIHLVVTRDFATRTGSCYINGELAQTVDFLDMTNDGYQETSTETMVIGASNIPGSESKHWFRQGAIHSVAAYSDIRTANEVAANYENGITEIGEDLLAYYVLSPYGNVCLRDYSSYENHLSITNGDMSKIEEKYLPLTEDEICGTTFDWNTYYVPDGISKKAPLTLETTIYFPEYYLSSLSGGVIYGNYNGNSPCYSFEIYTNGNPRLYVQSASGGTYNLIFDAVNVYNGKKTHLAVSVEANAVNLYVDGALAQSKTAIGIGAAISEMNPTRDLLVGGDWRERNYKCFKGQIVDLALYSDARTASEIASDYHGYGTDGLIGCYDLSESGAYPKAITDLSGNGHTLRYTNYLYDYEIPENFAYSLAILGDTQYVNERYPHNFDKIYDWLLDNKDSHKIQYVMGLGDITDKDNQYEWERAKTQFARLDGILPYSLVRGNHDSSEGINGAFNTEAYNATIDGKYGDGIENTYRLITIGKVNYLIMTLDFGYKDDVIAWANDVIASHPDYNVIITTHGYLAAQANGLLTGDGAPSTYDSSFNDADDLWDKLIRKHENISFVICGHVTAYTTYVVDAVGDNGNIVKQVLVNPQQLDASMPDGLGLVTLLYFNEDGTRMDIGIYSTIYDAVHRAEVVFNPKVSVVTDCEHDGLWVDGVCSGCERECMHVLEDVNGKSVCTVCGYTYSGVYVKHVADLSINKTVDGPFFIAGYRYADKALIAVEATPKGTWSEDWLGNWIPGYSKSYITQTSEWGTAGLGNGSDARIKFDMYYMGDGTTVAAVVGFTAQQKGVFNIAAHLRKVESGNPRITVIKNDGTVLRTIDVGGWGDEIIIDIDNLALEKGEQVLILVEKGYNEGQKNVGFISYEVEAIYEQCLHVYTNGVCDICGEACKHTAVSIVNKKGVCTDCDSTLNGVYVDHKADLTIYNPHDRFFFIAGIRLSDKALFMVEDNARDTWGNPGAWPGNWVINGEAYVTVKTQSGDDTVIFDLTPGSKYSSVVGFTAAADGVFNIKAELKKVWGGTSNVYLMTEDGKTLYTKQLNGGSAVADIDVQGIQLKKGEKLIIVVEYVSGGECVGFRSMSVEAFYTECPHSYIGNSKCDLCGETCKHPSASIVDGKGVCSDCGAEMNGVYVNHVSDLTIYTPHDRFFFIGGLKLSDNSVVMVEDTPRRTWGDAWPGNWLVNGDTYVTTVTEKPDDSTVRFDLKPRSEYNPLVGFIAPADGVFNVKAEFRHIGWGVGTLVVMSESGEVYWSGNVADNNAVIIDITDVVLEKGEKLLIVGSHVSGSEKGIGLRSFAVEAFYEECPHTYGADYKCEICGESCPHNPVISDKQTVCYDCGKQFGGVYVTHSSDLTIYKPVDGPFFIGAIRLSDGLVRPVEDAPRATWSDAWPGNWIANYEGEKGYITQISEFNYNDTPTDSRVRFDMYYNADGTHGALVGFTAMGDGVFNIDALLRKIWGGSPTITVMKNDGTVLYQYVISEYAEEIAINLDNVVLNKGEQVLIVVEMGNYTGSSKNVGFISYDVEAVYETCPHFYGDDYVCDACGEDNTVEGTKNNFEEIFSDVFFGGELDENVEGPSDGALENSGASKGEDVDGFRYRGFNVELVEGADYVYLRHHVLLDGITSVKVNGNSVNLVNVEGNYYYFDVKVAIGDFAKVQNITVNGTTVVSASVHSYMKTAFESGELDPGQDKLLKALYDWDLAVANAK